MRLLLDESLPRPLGRELTGHEVTTVAQLGWAGLKNGELLRQLLDGRDASPLSIRERSMDFEILGGIEDVRVIAKGSSVRERARLEVLFGPGR